MAKARLEADYKRDMVKQVRAAGGYARRIEDMFAVGTLDLLFKLPDTEMLVAEAKRFTGRKFALSPRQYEEARRVVVAGGYVACIGVNISEGGRIYLHGLPNKRDGVVYANDCVVQNDGENFPELLTRWWRKEYARRNPKEERTQYAVQSSETGVAGSGEPARQCGSEFPADWSVVD